MLTMEIDPVTEWRRLTEHYREMADVQLTELARDFADLTEAAQQVLRDELRHRGLPLPGSAIPQTIPVKAALTSPASAADESDSREDADEVAGEPIEYTWKTVLCECEESDQVWQLQEMLRCAGIDSWPDGPQSIGDSGLLYPRILVAADQLEEARAVIARPVPQDVIDQSHEPTPEYEMPRCPNCRAEDPTLEDTEPVNAWRCEACGRQWSDPAPIGEAWPARPRS